MYSVFGRCLASEIPLTLARAAGPPEWRIRRSGGELDWNDWRWYHETRLPDGTLWSRWATSSRRKDSEAEAQRLVVQFPGHCSFVLALEEREISVHGGGELPAHTLQHLLVDQVFPLALSATGDFVVHGSAVARGDQGIAFLGDSGLGKSTMATFLSTRGWRFATDDALRIIPGDELRAFPGTAVARLWDDSSGVLASAGNAVPIAHYTSKVGVEIGPRRVVTESFAVNRIYLLAEGAEVAISVPSPQDAFAGILRSSFRIAIEDRATLTRELKDLERVVRSGVVRRLSYPRDFSLLSEVAETVERDNSIR